LFYITFIPIPVSFSSTEPGGNKSPQYMYCLFKFHIPCIHNTLISLYNLVNQIVISLCSFLWSIFSCKIWHSFPCVFFIHKIWTGWIWTWREDKLLLNPTMAKTIY